MFTIIHTDVNSLNGQVYKITILSRLTIHGSFMTEIIVRKTRKPFFVFTKYFAVMDGISFYFDDSKS